MIRARCLLALAVAALVAVPAAGADSSFSLRRVDVSGYPVIRLVVRSAQASAVPRVFENGRPAGSLSYHNLGSSKAISLAVDRSQSMTGEPLKQAGAAADRLVHRKRRSDVVEIVTFGSTALAQTSFSQSTIDADNALAALAPDERPGTALYDAVVTAAANLKAQGLAGRVLVLLTDGRDVRSLASLSDALHAARAASVVVYTIALGHAAVAPLRELARGTGGTFYSSPTPGALASIYAHIASELSHTWKVSYTTNARPGDHIAVSVGTARSRPVRIVLPGRKVEPYKPLIPRTLLHNFGSVFLLGLAVATLLFLAVGRVRALPRAERIRRLVLDHTDPLGRARESKPRQPLSIMGVVNALNERFRGVPQLERLDRLVESAGVPLSAATILAGSIVAAFVLALFAAVTTASGTVIIFLFLIGLAAPFVSLRIRARRRIRAFEALLPDVLATIASSLRVGHGLKHALQTVAHEGPPPVNIEVRRVLSEARLGRPLEEALVAMCERLGSDDLLYVAAAVDVQSQVGGSLAGIFQTVADTVRERQQHRRRVRAVTSSGRATATVLALMPFGFLALMLLAAPDYITPFLNSGLGHVLLVFSVVSITIGGILLNRIVSVKA